MTHNLQATVFVYRHNLTKRIQCEYIEKAKFFEDLPQWEHLGTLEPRMWIQEHWNDVESKK